MLALTTSGSHVALHQRHDTALSWRAPGPNTETRGGTRLFVADQHPLILESLRHAFLALDPFTEMLAFTGLSALETALSALELSLKGNGAPDLVLLDFTLPGLASVEAVGSLIARHPDHRFAMICGHVDAQLVRNLLRIGCVGFVPKSLSPNTFHDAVRLMIGGHRFLPECLAELPYGYTPVPLGGDTAAAQVRSGPRKFGLTGREMDVLRSLATGKSNKQIGRDLDISEVTVKLHLRRCYVKLGVHNRIGALCAVFAGALD